jgi:predicted dehydrogenase
MGKQGRNILDVIERNEISRRNFLHFTGSAAMAALGAGLVQAGTPYAGKSDKVIRMGLVGGGFGRYFSWHEHPNCKITGVTDLIPELRDVLKTTFKCDQVYDSLEEMIKKAKDIDAVAIFSGANRHAKHVKMCMENGWHVVSACPACFTLEEAAMMKEVKERTGMKYMMAESSYWRPESIFARNLYKEGGFGELVYTECEYYHDVGRESIKDGSHWVYKNLTPGEAKPWRWGLPMMMYPTHALAYVVGISKERITKVSSLGWGDDSPWCTDNLYKNPFWNEASMMRTNKGHMCRCNGFLVTKSGGERANWLGTDLSLYMPDEFHGTVKLPVGELKIPNYWETSDMIPEKMRHESGHGGSAIFIAAEFINALLEDWDPQPDLYESLAMTVPGIVAFQSSLKDGEQLQVPQFDPS